MVIGIKDAAKLFGVSVIVCCAVLVCTMFLNYYVDISGIEDQITSEAAMIFYKAQVSTAKVVCMVSGGCLLITSVVMLIFYIKHYIDTHKKELGILKALGYSNFSVARNFGIFGVSVLIGSIVGFGGAFLIMPGFYEMQNEEKILPEFSVGFHPFLFVCFVILPAFAFAVISVLYACIKLRSPALSLLRETYQTSGKIKKRSVNGSGNTFIHDLKRSILRSRKSLVFFIIFSSFCFSAMTQMSFGVRELSSDMMAIMIITIGLVLAFTTLFIAVTTVVHGSRKTIAMMRAFGYAQKDCCGALLGGYRPLAYVGFAIGTVYQYGLLRAMVDIVFKDVENMPEYKFDVPVMVLSFVVFIFVYEIVMFVYSEKIKKISIKEIMIE